MKIFKIKMNKIIHKINNQVTINYINTNIDQKEKKEVKVEVEVLTIRSINL